MQQSVIKTSRIQREFNEAVELKCKVAGLNMAVDFLQTKARRSIRTGLNMSHALRYFNAYTKSCYKMDLEQIVSALKQEKIDVYEMLNSFVKYLQEEMPKGAMSSFLLK